MTMDLTQASQMLKWLDEERRKDKSLIAALQERLETQAEQLARQEEQLTGLQKGVASLEVLLEQVTEFTRTVERLKAEVLQIIDQRDETRRKEQRETDRARQLEIGSLKDELGRITEELRAIPRLRESMTAIQTEESRLNENLQRLQVEVSDLSKRTEDRLQTVVYLEEQRRADHQRITSLEMEAGEVRKRVESLAAKLPLLEDIIRKYQARLEEGLEPIKGFAKTIEEVRVAEFQRSQEVKKWLGQAQEVREEVERLREERQRFLTIHRDASEALKQLESFRTRIEARQNELSEMQRLAEERIKRQWEEWQTGQEKRRRDWELNSEERWRLQEQVNERHKKQLDRIFPLLKHHHTQLSSIWEMWRTDASHLLKTAQDRYEKRIAASDQQISSLNEHPVEEV